MAVGPLEWPLGADSGLRFEPEAQDGPVAYLPAGALFLALGPQYLPVLVQREARRPLVLVELEN